MSKADPATWGAALHTAQLNGITMRYADTAATAAERRLPVVLMMHGWPSHRRRWCQSAAPPVYLGWLTYTSSWETLLAAWDEGGCRSQ